MIIGTHVQARIVEAIKMNGNVASFREIKKRTGLTKLQIHNATRKLIFYHYILQEKIYHNKVFYHLNVKNKVLLKKMMKMIEDVRSLRSQGYNFKREV